MANQTGRPVAPARKLIAAVLGTIAVFVMVFGLGLSSWPIVALGAALLALAIALGMVNVVRRGARAWVTGHGQVKNISEPPGTGAFGRAELQLVVVAPGLPVTEVLVREPRVPVSKWPRVNETLPISVDVDDMRRVKIDWADVDDRSDDGDPPQPVFEPADEFLDDDLLGEPEPPPWMNRDRQWGTGPDDPTSPAGMPAADHSSVATEERPGTAVVVHDTPGGPVLEGQLVEHNTSARVLPQRAPRPPAQDPPPAATYADAQPATPSDSDTSQPTTVRTESPDDPDAPAAYPAASSAEAPAARSAAGHSAAQHHSGPYHAAAGERDARSADQDAAARTEPSEADPDAATRSQDAAARSQDTAARSQDTAARSEAVQADEDTATRSETTQPTRSEADPDAAARTEASKADPDAAGRSEADRDAPHAAAAPDSDETDPGAARPAAPEQPSRSSYTPVSEQSHPADTPLAPPSREPGRKPSPRPRKATESTTTAAGQVPTQRPAEDHDIDLPLDDNPDTPPEFTSASSEALRDDVIAPPATTPRSWAAGSSAASPPTELAPESSPADQAEASAEADVAAATGDTGPRPWEASRPTQVPPQRTAQPDTGVAAVRADTFQQPSTSEPYAPPQNDTIPEPRTDHPAEADKPTHSRTDQPAGADEATRSRTDTEPPANLAADPEVAAVRADTIPPPRSAEDATATHADTGVAAVRADTFKRPAGESAAPTSEATAATDAPPAVGTARVTPASGQTPHPAGSPWADLEGTGYEPNSRTDEVITAYPSARPGPAGAIHGVGITVLVTDLARSIVFYRDTLGFFQIDSGPGSAVLASGDTRLVLRTVHSLAPDVGRLIYLNLEVGDVDAIYEDLQGKGVKFLHGPRPVNRGDKLELWAATFYDPDGHNIAVTQWRAIS